MKKLTCLLLILCLLMSFAPASALAWEETEPADLQEEPSGYEILFLPEELTADEERKDLTIEISVEEAESDDYTAGISVGEEDPGEQTSEEVSEPQFVREDVPEVTADEAPLDDAAWEAGLVEDAQEAGPEEPAPEARYEETQPENTDPELPEEVQTAEETPAEESIAEPLEEELLIWGGIEETDEDNSVDNPLKEPKAEDQPAEESETEETKEKQPEISDGNMEDQAETPSKELVAEEEESKSDKKDAVQQNLNSWTLKTIDGSTITQDTYKKKIQLLIFYRGGMENGEGICSNSNKLISDLADTWWPANSDVQVIAIESSGCTRAETKAYRKTYAPDANDVIFAFAGEELMMSAAEEAGYTLFGLYYPMCFIIRDGDCVDCRAGYITGWDCENMLRQYVDLGTDPRLKQTRVDGVFQQTEARKMLKMINDFRTTGKVWYWNSDNKTKTVLNTNSSNTLGTLSYDYDLEQVAMKRAQELAVYYAHQRPNGQMCTTLSVNGTTCWGENIAYGTSGYYDVDQVFKAWREDDDDYNTQGHRRNMLYKDFTAVGFGCYVADDGFTYWTQEFGYENSGAAKTEADNGSAPALIDYNPDIVQDIKPYKPESLERAIISKISVGKEGITIQWNTVSGASKYQISRQIKGGNWKSLGTTSSLSFTDPDVESGTSYQYRVRAQSDELTGAYSKVKSVTYIDAPTLSSVKPTKTAVRLKWKNTTGAAKIQIWRRVKTSGSWGSWKKLATVAESSYTDKTVKSGKSYQYRLRSVNSSGKAVNEYSNAKKITFIKAPVLAKPTVAKRAVTLSWNKVSGAVKYRVFRKGPGDQGWIALKDLTKTQFVDRTTTKGQKYSYAVRCITKSGTKYTSVLSTARTITAK